MRGWGAFIIKTYPWSDSTNKNTPIPEINSSNHGIIPGRKKWLTLFI
jgi:hypothetical protein